MEPLALLCNLYGEGPSTKRRLQSVGLATLEDLVATDTESLIERTGWEPDEANEFMEQARSLAERLGAGLLEYDGETAPPSSTTGDGEVRDIAGSGKHSARTREAERCESVLATWRELDDSDPSSADLIVPQPPPNEDSFEEVLDLFAGDLSEDERRRFMGLGVSSLSEFVTASTLEVARELELGFTRVRRLQFLASRLGDAVSTPRDNSLATPPAGQIEPGPAGPFA